jgi:succinate dehydrogenase/fumarate reductase flavoprotein subunit
MKDVRVYETDVLIIGTEGAGARAAIEICRESPTCRVTAVTKGRFTQSGATLTAGTDINLDGISMMELFGFKEKSVDTKETFFEDIIIEGRYLNNQKLVQIMVEEAPQAIKEVADWGMNVTGYWRAAGHRYPRGILSTGMSMMSALKKKVKEYKDRITIHEDVMVVDLILDDQKAVSGAVGLDMRTGEAVVYIAKATLLATGGGLRVYPWTSGPEELTGDGQAMAYRAGCELTDMEFVQFLICTLECPPTKVKSVNPFLNLGAWLLNSEGQRFMKHWDPDRMEQSTRDNLAIGIISEILDGRGFRDDKTGFVLVSMKHLPEEILELNQAVLSWVDRTFINKMKGGAAPCFPACHFYCGGVRIDESFKTNVAGLYAVGEISGGMHGANRLSGNAITEVIVAGKLVGKGVADFITQRGKPTINESHYSNLVEKVFWPLGRYQSQGGESPITIRKTIQKIAGTYAPVVRDDEGLNKALGLLNQVRNDIAGLSLSNNERVYNREWIEALQVENMATTLEMIVRSALVRKESRGGHYRRDYPQTDNHNWLKNTLLKKDDKDRMIVDTMPAVLTKLYPKEN